MTILDRFHCSLHWSGELLATYTINYKCVCLYHSSDICVINAVPRKHLFVLWPIDSADHGVPSVTLSYRQLGSKGRVEVLSM